MHARIGAQGGGRAQRAGGGAARAARGGGGGAGGGRRTIYSLCMHYVLTMCLLGSRVALLMQAHLVFTFYVPFLLSARCTCDALVLV